VLLLPVTTGILSCYSRMCFVKSDRLHLWKNDTSDYDAIVKRMLIQYQQKLSLNWTSHLKDSTKWQLLSAEKEPKKDRETEQKYILSFPSTFPVG